MLKQAGKGTSTLQQSSWVGVVPRASRTVRAMATRLPPDADSGPVGLAYGWPGAALNGLALRVDLYKENLVGGLEHFSPPAR